MLDQTCAYFEGKTIAWNEPRCNQDDYDNNTEDFNAFEMCCVCGGGKNIKTIRKEIICDP